MKRKTLPLPRKGSLTAIVAFVLIISCKKEYSYEGGFKNERLLPMQAWTLL
jgi:hypothetical protein